MKRVEKMRKEKNKRLRKKLREANSVEFCFRGKARRACNGFREIAYSGFGSCPERRNQNILGCSWARPPSLEHSSPSMTVSKRCAPSVVCPRSVWKFQGCAFVFPGSVAPSGVGAIMSPLVGGSFGSGRIMQLASVVKALIAFRF